MTFFHNKSPQLQSSQPDEFLSKLTPSSHADSNLQVDFNLHADSVSCNQVNVPTLTPIADSRYQIGRVDAGPGLGSGRFLERTNSYRAYSGGLTPLYLAISDGALQLCHDDRCGRLSSHSMSPYGEVTTFSMLINNPKGSTQTRDTTKAVPLPLPTRIVQARKFELDEELLQIFKKVKINITFLDAIKQILKYAKFLKELCAHKSKKLKGDVEMETNISALIKTKKVSTLIQPTMLKRYRDPGTFPVPCTIGKFTFVDAMLDLGAN
ncbi:hypothetical protein CR513_12539, partial [Mucuna pruriens]